MIPAGGIDLFNRPMLLHSRSAAASALIARHRGALDSGDRFQRAGQSWQRGYDVVSGIAVIGVMGLLVQRTDSPRTIDGMTGYDAIRAAFLGAMRDRAVKALVFYFDSPGGDVAGCFDLADLIYRQRGKGKPIWAICAEVAYSAAYAIASACDRVTVPRTGGVGSIGVICMLVDYSKALKGAGVAVHFIVAGERKAEAGRAELQGVEAGVLKRLQTEIDAVADIFFRTVARNRGLSVAAVRAQEGDTYLGREGVARGLADTVCSPDTAFRDLFALVAREKAA